MYNRLLEELKKKFPGFPEKILERKATQLAKTTTTEEQVTTAIEGVTIQQLIDSEGDRRANEAQQSAVKNYEEKHKLKDGKPVEEPKPATKPKTKKKSDDDDDDDDNPVLAMLKEMREENKKLQERLDNMDGERTAKSRRNQYEQLFSQLKDTEAKDRYMRDFDRLSFKDDDDFKTWLDERTPVISKEVDAINQRNTVNHPPRGGRSTTPAGEASADVKTYLDAETARESAQQFSSIAGMPGKPAAGQ